MRGAVLNSRVLISIDPGYHTGVAVWNNGVLSTVFHVNAPAKGDAVAKTFSLMQQLAEELEPLPWGQHVVATMVVEWPQFFGGAGGRMCAARGDLVKLTVVVGALLELARRAGMHFVGITPQDWRGQLTQRVVNNRVRALLKKPWKEVPFSDHEIDAIGIGLYQQGVRL